MNAQILKLNKAGNPTAWIDYREAATITAKGLVLWTFGGASSVLRGGISRMTGRQSIMEIPPVIAVEGKVKDKAVPKINNKLLFARDGHLCMYCGTPGGKLTRDHIMPTSRGGADTWTNCCACCSRCNNQKDDRTLDECGMKLLAVPYAPTVNEYFALDGRNVLADQMDYLRGGFRNLSA